MCVRTWWEDLFMFCSTNQNRTPLSFTPSASWLGLSRWVAALHCLIIHGRFVEQVRVSCSYAVIFMVIYQNIKWEQMRIKPECAKWKCHSTMECHKNCSLSSHWHDVDGFLYLQWPLTQCPHLYLPTAGKPSFSLSLAQCCSFNCSRMSSFFQWLSYIQY